MIVEDSVLVKKALLDSREFGPIVERYEKKLDSYLRSIIYSSKEDREDILQEIFIAVYRFLNTYDTKFSFSTWIYKIAHNKAVSFLRKHGTRIASEYVAKSEEEDVIDSVVSDEDIEKNVEHLLSLEQVKGKLELLSSQDREILLLRFCEQKEYNEISAILRIPEGTVASLIHRAKAKLKILVAHDKTE